MRRLSRHLLSTLSAGAALLSVGCVDNDSSLFIVGIMRPNPPECEVQADSSAVLLGEGNLDLALSPEFRGWLLVGNQLTPRGIKQQVRTETARVSLKGAEVTLTNPDGSGIDGGEFTVPGSGFVSVNRSEDPAFGAFLTTLIPASVSSGFSGLGGGARQTVVANVRVFGETLGGTEIESAEFSYPIQICAGCLVTYPPDALDANGNCTLPSTEPTNEVFCFFGQQEVDCRECRARDIPYCTGQ